MCHVRLSSAIFFLKKIQIKQGRNDFISPLQKFPPQTCSPSNGTHRHWHRRWCWHPVLPPPNPLPTITAAKNPFFSPFLFPNPIFSPHRHRASSPFPTITITAADNHLHFLPSSPARTHSPMKGSPSLGNTTTRYRFFSSLACFHNHLSG
jgi:hypothetical protein